MGRRKYDTEALVGQIKKERRASIILTMAGVFILFVLVGLYFTMGDEDVPTVPAPHPAMAAGTTTEGGAPPPVAGTETPGAEPGAVEPGAEPPGNEPPAAEEPAKPAKPAKLSIKLNKKTVVWVNGKKIGKVKKKNLELPPGKHTIEAKAGKKKITQEIEVKGGESFSLKVDVKKRKATLKTK